MTKLTKYETSNSVDKGFICNFDVTDNLLSGNNILKLYMYIANKGTGAKFLYCKTPADILTASSRHCELQSSYDSATSQIPGLTLADGDFSLVKIKIKKTPNANTVDIQINTGAEVYAL